MATVSLLQRGHGERNRALENPYMAGTDVEPPLGGSVRRSFAPPPRMIVHGSVVDRAFASIGRWGERWSSIQDYQHFSRSGQ